MKKLTTEEFIARSTKIHNNKYDYSKSIYTTNKNKITIVCPIHGEFEQNAMAHLKGCGCNKCAISYRAALETNTATDYINKASKIHNGKYTYQNLDYQTVHKKGTITCPTHGDFKQKLNAHLNGQGCPICARQLLGNGKRFFTGKPTILYVIKVHNNLFKVGVTTNSVKQRYYSILKEKYEILFQTTFFNGLDAYMLEQHTIQMFKAYRYTGELIFKHTKNNEVFTINPTKFIEDAIIKEQLNAIITNRDS